MIWDKEPDEKLVWVAGMIGFMDCLKKSQCPQTVALAQEIQHVVSHVAQPKVQGLPLYQDIDDLRREIADYLIEGRVVLTPEEDDEWQSFKELTQDAHDKYWRGFQTI